MQWLFGDTANPVDVNSRRSIIAIVYIAVIAPCVFILQPGYVQGLVEYLAFSEEQAGYIASAEMFGIAFTTLLLVFMEARVDWRKLTVLCLILAAAGNLLSLSLADFESLAAVRFLTGMGSGGLMSLTFAMMGLTGKSDRNFGLYHHLGADLRRPGHTGYAYSLCHYRHGRRTGVLRPVQCIGPVLRPLFAALRRPPPGPVRA